MSSSTRDTTPRSDGRRRREIAAGGGGPRDAFGSGDLRPIPRSRGRAPPQRAGLLLRPAVMDEPIVAGGTVYLVGAGPGDPGLLTRRGHQVLQHCDVVLFDALVSAEVLALARRRAVRMDVGKRGHGPSTLQPDINAVMVDHARAGRCVVRLKGGDPFLFGRGSEEAEALAAAGIPFEIVPGVSSALAVPAYAGIPVTDRRLASSLAIVTAACAAPGEAERSIARAAGADTVVVLMGLSTLARVTAALTAHGRCEDTPAAAISAGTTRRQRTVVATLGTLAAAARDASLTSPVLIVVGDVVRMRSRLAWFEPDVDGARRARDEPIALPVHAPTDRADRESITAGSPGG